jgi:hypothetical protein
VPMTFRSRRSQNQCVDSSLRVVDSGYRLRPSNQNANVATAGWAGTVGLAWAALLIGLMPVVTALVRGQTWSAEPTVGLALSCLGVAGLGRYYTCAARHWARRRNRRRWQTPQV